MERDAKQRLIDLVSALPLDAGQLDSVRNSISDLDLAKVQALAEEIEDLATIFEGCSQEIDLLVKSSEVSLTRESVPAVLSIDSLIGSGLTAKESGKKPISSAKVILSVDGEGMGRGDEVVDAPSAPRPSSTVASSSRGLTSIHR